MSAVIESTERAPGLPRPIDPANFPALRDHIVATAFGDTSMEIVTLKLCGPFADAAFVREYIESAIRWAVIDAYYAGLRVGRESR